MEDNLPKEYSPWRRFFARNLDFAVYSILWKVILIKALNYNILRDSIGMDFLGEIVALLMML